MPPIQTSSLKQDIPLQEIIVKLHSFISRRYDNNDNVGDLVQETLIRTLTRNKIDKIENIQAYTNQVAKSVMYNHWQKSISQPSNAEEIEQLTSENINPEIHAINLQKIKLVNNVLDSMPPLRKKVFKMRRIDGLTRSEIAEQLQISQESVKKHITRAMIQITTYLESS